MRWVRVVVASAMILGACTRAPVEGSPSAPTAPTPQPSVVPTGARLPDGTPLPEACIGGAGPSDTVAFVADDRAWALDPEDGDLDCLFPVDDAGPFVWGPQGDRVVLSDFEIRGLDAEAPDLPPIDVGVGAFDWGHPLGLAIVFADAKGSPRKRFMDGRLIRLRSLPAGEYREVAYHPSGLALAFVVETDDGQEIWLSTNEGEEPTRLVFSLDATRFTSLAFSPNGRVLWWTALHEDGSPQLHFMKLASRTGFGTAWRGPPGTTADSLRLAPVGFFKAVTEGEACEDRRALVLSSGEARVAIPDEVRPTEALGWLDRTTLLVSAGGCGGPIDLFAVDGLGLDAPAALVLGVEIAAPRTQVENPPKTVPAPAPDLEPPPDGVG